MNDLRQVNEMPISNIIFVFARGCYFVCIRSDYYFFILNVFSYCMYCYFT